MRAHTRSHAATPVLIGVAAAIVVALMVALLFVVLKPGSSAVTAGTSVVPSGKQPVISENGNASNSASHESPTPDSRGTTDNAEPSDGSGTPSGASAGGTSGESSAAVIPEAFASLPAPTSPNVEPDNDIDAETGEPLASPAAGEPSGTLASSLPAPTDTSVAPDNDVSAS